MTSMKNTIPARQRPYTQQRTFLFSKLVYFIRLIDGEWQSILPWSVSCSPWACYPNPKHGRILHILAQIVARIYFKILEEKKNTKSHTWLLYFPIKLVHDWLDGLSFFMATFSTFQSACIGFTMWGVWCMVGVQHVVRENNCSSNEGNCHTLPVLKWQPKLQIHYHTLELHPNMRICSSSTNINSKFLIDLTTVSYKISEYNSVFENSVFCRFSLLDWIVYIYLCSTGPCS